MTSSDTGMPETAAEPRTGAFLANFRSLTPQESQKLIDWVLNYPASRPPAYWATEEPEFHALEGFEPRWAVLQCIDSLVWCVREEDRWRWACEADPQVREPRASMLMEARVFGPSGEVMAWPVGDGSFAGRWLKPAALCSEEPSLSSSTPDLRPLNEYASFEADDVTPLDGVFMHRRVRNGRITITPGGSGVEVIQHLQEDPYGIVRVAATQFVRVVQPENIEGD